MNHNENRIEMWIISIMLLLFQIAIVLNQVFFFNEEIKKAEEIYKSIKNSKSSSVYKSHSSTFIALDERERIIIFDKSTGNYTIYSDTLGNAIFRMYAAKIFQKNEKN